MTTRPGVILAACSVSIIAVVNAAAATQAPPGARAPLLLCGSLAVVIAMQAALRDPAALAGALLFSVPPVIALAAADSPTWLIGPLGVMLLVAGELNALNWELRGAGPKEAFAPRVRNIGYLGGLSLAASLAVGVFASGPPPGGTAAVVLGGTALAALAIVLFGRAT